MTEEGHYTCLVDLPPYEGVGEHEHQELMLMLEGRKKLALFLSCRRENTQRFIDGMTKDRAGKRSTS